jgi:hypothetical protein
VREAPNRLTTDTKFHFFVKIKDAMFILAFLASVYSLALTGSNPNKILSANSDVTAFEQMYNCRYSYAMLDVRGVSKNRPLGQYFCGFGTTNFKQLKSCQLPKSQTAATAVQ